MFTIYGFAMLLDGKQYYTGFNLVSKTYYLIAIYMSLLPVYAFYVFGKKEYLTEKTMRPVVFVFLILAVVNYISNQDRLLQMAIEIGSSAEAFTNNAGYSFVGLLPALVLFQKKPVIQYFYLGVCFFFIISSMKRGAMLAGGLCMLWFLANNIRSVSKKQKWLSILISLLVLAAGVYYVRNMMVTSSYFQYRMTQTEAGDSSGRDELYSSFLQHFLQEEHPFRFLFGNGADATLLLMRQYAHNDWLEIAINQGLLGLLVYLIYWISLFRSWRSSKHSPQAFMSVGMFLIIYFLETLFSMSYNGVSKCAAMVLGYYLAVSESKKVFEYTKNTGLKNYETHSLPH